MKRSLGPDSTEYSPPKRLRASESCATITKLKHHRLNHHQPNVHLVLQTPQNDSVVTAQLSRALCVALYNAGFTSVQHRALESFTAAVQEYMNHFCQNVVHSMHASRRLKPLPQDFIHALAAFSLTSSSFETDLALPIPPLVTQPPLITATTSTETDPSAAFVLSTGPFLPTTETALPPKRRRHIPTHFPLLPPPHAYKNTPVFTARETDVRRIRERATEEGMEAEKALRKLVKASKAGGRKRRSTQAGGKTVVDGKVVDKEEELWKETLAALGDEEDKETTVDAGGNGGYMFGTDGAADDPRNGDNGEAGAEMEAGMMVNYERAFWRKANRGGALGTV